MLKRSCVTIDISRIVQNYKILTALAFSGQQIMPVIKANAYGHGDIEVAKALEKVGCSSFCVATIDEAIRLKENGIKSTILILGYTSSLYAKEIAKYGFHQTIISKEHLIDFLKTGERICVHFKIDTGMHRVGFEPNTDTEKLIRNAADSLDIKGVYTHLCASDDNEKRDFTLLQIDKFKGFCKRIGDLNLPFIHCFNTAGALNFNDGFSTHLRIGIALFGLAPCYSFPLPFGVLPALSWDTEVAMVKKVKKGESVGYGMSETMQKDSVIATLTTGYADGFSRALSCKGKVFINGKKARIVGKICMDQMMVDVTGMTVKQGDRAMLLCDYYTADDMAKDIGTISYEITTRITDRVSRIYKN